MIFIASDHGGFELKSKLAKFLIKEKIKFKDLGPKVLNQDDDYPDFAFPLAKKVAASPKNLGILVCRNGIGVSIAANKVKGVKAGICTFVGQAVTARAHTDCNILVLAADFVPLEKNLKIVKTFLEGEFSGEERHQRRLKKIEDYETRLR
jgi:ribose 5-phosphate isomerase B